jgi:hypothetical protein
MKAGGNRKAKLFLESHDDWDPDSPITVKYNSRAAALYKDKVGRPKIAQNKMYPNM